MKYKYRCSNPECNHETIIQQSMKEDQIRVCPECKQETFGKVIEANPFILKGEGWESLKKSGRYHE